MAASVQVVQSGCRHQDSPFHCLNRLGLFQPCWQRKESVAASGINRNCFIGVLHCLFGPPTRALFTCLIRQSNRDACRSVSTRYGMAPVWPCTLAPVKHCGTPGNAVRRKVHGWVCVEKNIFQRTSNSVQSCSLCASGARYVCTAMDNAPPVVHRERSAAMHSALYLHEFAQFARGVHLVCAIRTAVVQRAHIGCLRARPSALLLPTLCRYSSVVQCKRTLKCSVHLHCTVGADTRALYNWLAHTSQVQSGSVVRTCI